MSALLVGFVLVVGSAGAFGFALFGRRPVPQPATLGVPVQREPGGISESGRRGAPDTVSSAGTSTGTDVATPLVHLRARDVRPTPGRRIRAMALLSISVVGSALLIGAILSIIAVGAVLLIS